MPNRVCIVGHATRYPTCHDFPLFFRHTDHGARQLGIGLKYRISTTLRCKPYRNNPTSMLKRFFSQPLALQPDDLPEHVPELERLYQEQVRQKHIHHDPAQFEVLRKLQSLSHNLETECHYQQKPDALKLFTAQPKKSKSLYIHGGVGCGKSMLMDWFFECCAVTRKRRVHFHAFMLEVHEFVHQWRQRNGAEVIPALAKNISTSTQLLCFDEFHVTDIADAMILGRLFSQLFAAGVVIVATSNRHPDDLYAGGLQRELFLPFIRLLQEQADVVELASPRDYRLTHLRALGTTYFYPLGTAATRFIRQSYNELSNFAPLQPGSVDVLGRTVALGAVHGDIALSSFRELCEQPLGPADYLEIACEFSTLIIADIPRLTPEKRNQARRLVTLIDALYEHRVKLICSAEVPAEELYKDSDGAFEYQRTVSRLIAMQTDHYLNSQHLAS